MKTLRQFFSEAEELDDKPNPPKKHWGYELLVDASGCNQNINSIANIKLFYKELLKELKMKPLSNIMTADVHNEYARGVSAVQLITTSSIVLHTDDVHMSLYLDCFSCAPFVPQPVLDTLKKHFEPKRINHKMIYRDAG